jgi:hypothetical protein
MVFYLLVVAAIAVWKFVPRPWRASVKVETSHHIIYSTATRQQTEDTAHTLELLYNAYSNRMGPLPQFRRDHSKLKLKLFKDRAEFRWVNPNMGWAEAFYREPFCRAYFAAGESNPYHWTLHESTHQLNHEVAGLKLEKWLEEGLATYFSTSRLGSNDLMLGRIDMDAYPVWWIELIATEPDLNENIRNGSVIPLRTIILNKGGPSMNGHFNLYYVHWWTLTHFVFETPQRSGKALDLVRAGGGLEAFEKTIGPVEQVQQKWHAYVRQLRSDLGADPGNQPKPRTNTTLPTKQTAGRLGPGQQAIQASVSAFRVSLRCENMHADQYRPQRKQHGDPQPVRDDQKQDQAASESGKGNPARKDSGAQGDDAPRKDENPRHSDGEDVQK